MFLLQGNGSLTNLGCEAILRSTVDMLRAEFGSCRFVHAPASTLPDRTTAERDPDVVHDVPPMVKRFSWPHLIGAFRRHVLQQTAMPFEKHLPHAAAMLAVGGDQYSLSYGVPYGFFLANEAALRRGTPLFLWGASVGPFTKLPDFERFAVKALRRVTIICARETETVAYLDSVGVRDNVRLVADPAFLLEPARPAQLDIPEHLLDGSAIGLNLSPLLGKYRGGMDAWLSEATACTEALLEKVDRPVVLVPHVLTPGTDDHEFLAQVHRQLPQHAARLHLAGRHHDCREIKWIIARLGAFIGARTHSTIAAMSSGVPTLSIGYSIKAKGINRDLFGHERWLIPVEDLASGPFVERISELLGEADAVRTHLASALPAYKERARGAVKLVREHARLS
jgi:polysaccharide pyruvyl transferase WcaK-like protein